jgi:hypothetical protein
VVERSFAWINKHRRCVRDYETRPHHHEAMVHIAMIATMTRRLARTRRFSNTLSDIPAGNYFRLLGVCARQRPRARTVGNGAILRPHGCNRATDPRHRDRPEVLRISLFTS